MPAPTLQFKRGLVANLPGLKAGEPGFTTDFFELYVGIDSTTNNNKFLGSHRYWSKGSASTGSGVNLVEGTSNGSDFITLKAPDTLAGITTYTFPASPVNNNVLTTDANGVLSWTAVVSELSINSLISGIGTFNNNVAFTTTTNNTLGIETSGAVQLAGGMGIAKNLTVKENLHVGGFVEFVGAGVTINAGGINVAAGIVTAARFVSNVEFGTAPISVASSTLVNNLNAQYVGGFAAPTSEIVGSGNTQTLTNKTIALGDNTISGTLAQFNTALTDANFVSIEGIETLTNKTLTSPTLTNPTLGDAGATSINVSGITTTGTLKLLGTSGIGITGISSSTSLTENSHTFLPTQAAVKAYVDNVDITLGITADSGGPSTVGTAQTLTISGTTNEVNTAVSGQTITVGLPDSVTVTTALTTPTVNASNLKANDGTTSITITDVTGAVGVSSDLTVGGDLRINGNDIKASDGATNITLSSSTLTTFSGDIKVAGNDIQASDNTVAITLSGADVTVAGDLKVGGNDIKASDGTTAITLSAVTGNVGVSSNLTVGGNLFVNGTTTQVNTAALTVEDRTIDLGIVNGDAPGAPTTWDLGILFNYHKDAAAKKSAVIWEHTDSRFKFASILDSDTNGSDTSTPQLAVTTFAPIEIASLFVNDCAGASQVISCTGTTRNLENITIDAGTFV